MNTLHSRLQLASLMIIAAILLAGALLWLKPIMVPLVLAIMFSYMLAPVVDFSVQKIRLPKGIAIFFTLSLSVFLLVLTGSLISSSLGKLADKSAEYEEHILTLTKKSTLWVNEQLVPMLAEYNIHVDISQFSNILESIPISGLMGSMTNTILDLLSNTFLILIFVIYLLEGRNPKKKSSPLMTLIEQKIKRYLFIKFILSATTGILVGLLLGFLGVDLAMLFGLLTFILNFIPNIGSLIAMILPIPLVLVDPNFSLASLVMVVALPGAVQMIIGNVVEPKLLGDSLELHPITVLLSLIFWGMLWGLPGMLLAAPITAVLKILLESLELTKPVAKLLEGNITAAESATSNMGASEEEPETESVLPTQPHTEEIREPSPASEIEPPETESAQSDV
ncbi:MAG: AI-2E family transporter [Myxococcota bacterium]|nr:AI-2E family transporter [Myxococcota bacterium]